MGLHQQNGVIHCCVQDIQNQPLFTKTYDEMKELMSNFACTILTDNDSLLLLNSRVAVFSGKGELLCSYLDGNKFVV